MVLDTVAWRGEEHLENKCQLNFSIFIPHQPCSLSCWRPAQELRGEGLAAQDRRKGFENQDLDLYSPLSTKSNDQLPLQIHQR